MKKYILALMLMISFSGFIFGQISIGKNGAAADPSSILDVTATNKGLLLPRVNLTSNTDVTTIPNPKIGLMVYNLTTTGNILANHIYVWNGTIWDPTMNDAEIQQKKIPRNLLLVSKATQLLSTTELTDINSGKYVTVLWIPADVASYNSTYFQINSGINSITILQDGYYEISGFLQYTPVATNTSPVQLENIVQTRPNSTAAWANIYALTTQFENEVTTYQQTLTFPLAVKFFAAGTEIRLVMHSTSTNQKTGSGITAKVAGDLTKSFRLTRMN